MEGDPRPPHPLSVEGRKGNVKIRNPKRTRNEGLEHLNSKL